MFLYTSTSFLSHTFKIENKGWAKVKESKNWKKKKKRKEKETRVIQTPISNLKMKSIRIPRNRDGWDLVTPFEPAFDHVAVRNGARVSRRDSFVLVSTVFASATSRESRYHGREV